MKKSKSETGEGTEPERNIVQGDHLSTRLSVPLFWGEEGGGN